MRVSFLLRDCIAPQGRQARSQDEMARVQVDRPWPILDSIQNIQGGAFSSFLSFPFLSFLVPLIPSNVITIPPFLQQHHPFISTPSFSHLCSLHSCIRGNYPWTNKTHAPLGQSTFPISDNTQRTKSTPRFFTRSLPILT